MGDVHHSAPDPSLSFYVDCFVQSCLILRRLSNYFLAFHLRVSFCKCLQFFFEIFVCKILLSLILRKLFCKMLSSPIL